MSTKDFAGDIRRMDKAIEVLKENLSTLRAGRATPALVQKVEVEYYGTVIPINQIATIIAPEPRMLLIQPWDKSAIGAIEKAILKSDLGLTPTNDGQNIRLNIPQLTEERRKELLKLVHKMGEEAKVAVRNIRREINEKIKKKEKEKEITEDEAQRELEEIQKITNQHITEIDNLLKEKEKEIMTP